VRTSRHADELADDVIEAVSASLDPPGRVATLVLPQDLTWTEVDQRPSPAPRTEQRPLVGTAQIEAVAGALRSVGQGAILLSGGSGVRREGLIAAARIEAATGCRVLPEANPARLERGVDLPSFSRVPYFPEQAKEVFSSASLCILAGA